MATPARAGTPAPHPSIPWETLDRYYAGEATPEERQLVQAYLAAPSRAELFTQVMHAVRTEAAGPSPAPVEAMLAAAQERMLPANVIKRVVRNFFGGSIERAVAALLDISDRELDAAELARLRGLIDQAKREGR